MRTADYDNLVAIDSQVVLEAKPLDQLPWRELFHGSILLLVVRQVQTEIDRKKNDSRLGKRARAFNALLDGFIESRIPSTVMEEPRVDVATVPNGKIDWGALESLDHDDPDDRIVAQAINAMVDDRDRIVLLSHDMRPRDAAWIHGLTAKKLPESWLREPEPSRHDKRLKELEAKLKVAEADQPKLNVRVEAISPEPWSFNQVTQPTEGQVEAILQKKLSEAPQKERRGPFDTGLSYDYTYGRRLAAWKRGLSQDIPIMHKGLTRIFSQYRIRVIVKNIGPIPAENLSLEVRSGNAVLHSEPYWVLFAGEPTPHPMPFPAHLPRLHARDFQTFQREQFSFYWDESDPGDHLIQSCASFRQGKEHVVDLSVELIADTTEKAHIEAILTASNMKGDVRNKLLVDVSAVTLAFDDIVDPDTTDLRARPLVDMMDSQRFAQFKWFRNGGEEAGSD
jgi:hypothetical protein